VWLRLFRWGTYLGMRLLGARRTRRRVDGAELTVWTLGPEHGEPWVLLHGLGATSLSWAPALRALRRDCRVLVPELSLLGGTRAPRGALGVEDGARVAEALIAAEFGGRPVTLGGISLGGWMAVRAALRRPDLVARLVLVDAAGYRDQDWAAIRQRVAIATTAQLDSFARALFHRPHPFVRLLRPGLLAVFRSPAVSSAVTGVGDLDVYDDRDLARIEAPCAVIWGTDDGLFPLTVGERTAAALPHAVLHAIPAAGHAVQWDRPVAFVAALEDFRRRTPLGPAAR
jgi:pimeloyl-ACP methyl ester carboxylesterase